MSFFSLHGGSMPQSTPIINQEDDSFFVFLFNSNLLGATLFFFVEQEWEINIIGKQEKYYLIPGPD